MNGDHIDIWSEKEIVGYLNELVNKGSVKRCSKLKAELGYLNAYYPKCVGGFSSREEARNVKTSATGDSAPRFYAWPVCPEVCPFFEETMDFASSLLGKQIEERIIGKEALAIPEKETSAISETVDPLKIPRSDKKATFEPEKVPKEADQTIQRIDQTMPKVLTKRLKRLAKKTERPDSEHVKGMMRGDHIDIWSEKEVVGYLNELVKKGSVKRCSKLKAELGHLNAYYPKCMSGFASREKASNVKTSATGDSAPKFYAWPVCPEACPFFEETMDFASSLLGKPIEKRIIEKEVLDIPEMNEISIIQRHEEKETLEPEETLKSGDEITQKGDEIIQRANEIILRTNEIIQRSDRYLSERQIEKLRNLSEETGLPVSKHIQRAVDEYLSKHGMGKNEM